MKQVTAYEDSKGCLWKDREGVAKAEQNYARQARRDKLEAGKKDLKDFLESQQFMPDLNQTSTLYATPAFSTSYLHRILQDEETLKVFIRELTKFEYILKEYKEQKEER
jgi:hypothetical protein